MGKYINVINGEYIGASFESKCHNLESAGAVKVTDEKFLPRMVVVVDNGHFAAARYAFDEKEWKDFKYDDGRHKQWYVLENASNYID